MSNKHHLKWTLTLKEADRKVNSWLNVGLYSKYLWGFSRLAGFSLGSCREIFHITLHISVHVYSLCAAGKLWPVSYYGMRCFLLQPAYCDQPISNQISIDTTPGERTNFLSSEHTHYGQACYLPRCCLTKHTLPLQMHSFQWWKGIYLTWMRIHIKPLSLSSKSPMPAALSRYLIYSSPAHPLSLSGQTAQPYCLSFWGCNIQVVMIFLAPLWFTDTGFLINCVCLFCFCVFWFNW